MIIGHRRIWPPLLLAPMAGLTHSALRTTILGFGGVGLYSTEMLSAARLPAENAVKSPYLIRTEVESPLSYQLLLSNDQHLSRVFQRLHDLQADVVDLNLGCPAPMVRQSGGGSSLMERPDLVRRIVLAARRQTTLPLSAKIRLGEVLDASRLHDFCRMLEGEGLDMLTVHARLRAEPFSRPPRWEWIARIKEWIHIPVVANGSIDSVASAQACLRMTGADGLMIGRRAAVAPWLFAEIAREVFNHPVPEPQVFLPLVYRDFVLALTRRFAPERQLGRLKEFTHYFARNFFFGHHLASRVQASGSMEVAWSAAVQFFREQDPEGSVALEEWLGDADSRFIPTGRRSG